MHDKKNECRCNNHGSGGNTFLVGALVGGGLALLLSTKKGRAILRELSDRGLETLDNVRDLKNFDDLTEEVSSMSTAAEAVQNTVSEASEEVKPKSASFKRFFKGTKKK